MEIDGTVFVRLVDFPTCACGGMVLLNDDGTHTILLNSRLSHEQNLKSYLHEKNHIEHNDFYRGADVEDMEVEAG